MKLNMILPVIGFALAATFAVPTFAGGSGGATAGAVAGATAGATAGVDNSVGTALGGASIGGAYCVDTLVVGPIGMSKTMRPCVASQIAESGGKMGTLTSAEVRAIQLEALDRLGFGLRDANSTTVSKMNQSGKSASTAEKATMMTYNGDWKDLTDKSQHEIVACKVLWNSKPIESCVGKY